MTRMDGFFIRAIRVLRSQLLDLAPFRDYFRNGPTTSFQIA